MILSTEFFVLTAFFAGIIFIINSLRQLDMPGKNLFFLALIIYQLSNIFTVIESFFLYDYFNLLEHGAIFLGSLFMLLGTVRLLRGKR